MGLIAWRDDAASWRGFDFLEADVRFQECLANYLPRIAALDPDLCVYFECVHTRVNSTFQHVGGVADIRVFDFARGDRFLSFDDAVLLASRFQLPLVGWERCEKLDAALMWSKLDAARSRHYDSVPAPLEGFVVREVSGPRIAKARVEHLKEDGMPAKSCELQGPEAHA